VASHPLEALEDTKIYLWRSIAASARIVLLQLLGDGAHLPAGLVWLDRQLYLVR
jgi:hypothetical protein